MESILRLVYLKKKNKILKKTVKSVNYVKFAIRVIKLLELFVKLVTKMREVSLRRIEI